MCTERKKNTKSAGVSTVGKDSLTAYLITFAGLVFHVPVVLFGETVFIPISTQKQDTPSLTPLLAKCTARHNIKRKSLTPARGHIYIHIERKTHRILTMSFLVLVCVLWETYTVFLSLYMCTHVLLTFTVASVNSKTLEIPVPNSDQRYTWQRKLLNRNKNEIKRKKVKSTKARLC